MFAVCKHASGAQGAQHGIFLQQRIDAHGNETFWCNMSSYSPSLVNKHDTKPFAGRLHKVCRHMQLIASGFCKCLKQVPWVAK